MRAMNPVLEVRANRIVEMVVKTLNDRMGWGYIFEPNSIGCARLFASKDLSSYSSRERQISISTALTGSHLLVNLYPERSTLERHRSHEVVIRVSPEGCYTGWPDTAVNHNYSLQGEMRDVANRVYGPLWRCGQVWFDEGFPGRHSKCTQCPFQLRCLQMEEPE